MSQFITHFGVTITRMCVKILTSRKKKQNIEKAQVVLPFTRHIRAQHSINTGNVIGTPFHIMIPSNLPLHVRFFTLLQ